jgi:hypothetical protein|tara:strand:+ start:2102 stop:2803 length:702 start_codon:yes stop_codon:yes gene_type:complete
MSNTQKCVPNPIKSTELVDFFHQNRDKLSDIKFLQEFIQRRAGLALNIVSLGIKREDVEPCWGNFRCKQLPHELAQFLAFLKQHSGDISSYLEIGIATGGTFILIDGFLRATNESYRGSLGLELDNNVCLKLYGPYAQEYPSCKWIQIDSRFFEPQKQYDLWFIDGNHSYNFVLHDFNNALKQAKYIAIHDIALMHDVKRIWKNIKDSYTDTWEFINEDPNFGKACGIGVVKI